jgi:drug/metabolite transporter (DMT)-like permease
MQQKNPSKRNALPFLAVLATVFVWGLSFVSSKTILNTGVPPMTMVCIRFVIAAVVINIILKKVEPETRLKRKDVVPLLVTGLLGITVYFFFESRGIKLTSASHASLIIAAIPVFTVLGEILFFRQRITLLAAAGITLSVFGVFFVVRSPGVQISSGSLAGDLFMFGACMSWVAYILLSKNLHKRLSDLAITAYQSLFGTFFLIPFALLEHARWVPITVTAALNIVYLALFCSAAANFLYMYGLTRLGPIAISPFTNLVPVVGVIGGVVILGEAVGVLQIVGGVIIIAGVLLVGVRRGGESGPPSGFEEAPASRDRARVP